MKISPYLNFNGEAEAAANAYADLLGGTIANLHHYRDIPDAPGIPPVPAEWQGKVMHCCLEYPGGAISMADMPPSTPSTFGNNVVMTLYCNSVEHAEKSWAKLADGARSIDLPLGATFFAERYGELVDRFGVAWAVMFDVPCA